MTSRPPLDSGLTSSSITVSSGSNSSRWNWLYFSEETREMINRVTEHAKQGVYYGWIPFILLLGRSEILTIIILIYLMHGLGFWKSEPRPSIFRMLNPLS